ncbi:hypothetical protein GCM10009743_30730 [Kribbella swartbergensis]
MNRAQVAMAYQACEVADLARSAVTLHDPAEAVAQAELVLTSARRLLAAATRLAEPGPPTDPLQLFAWEHPDEAAADIADWLATSAGRSTDHAHGEGTNPSPSTRS